MKVTPQDLEAKFREVEDAVVETEAELKDRALLLAVGAAVVVVGVVAYSIWRSRRKRIRVEVYYQR